MTVTPVYASVGLVQGGLVCQDHGQTPVTWCEHIADTIHQGYDADLIYKGMSLEVPIFPTADLYVDVSLGQSGDEFGASALMKMHYVPDVGQPYDIPLGFWNPGEGMGSIRSVVLDYLKGATPLDKWRGTDPIKTKCPTNFHGMKEMRQVAELSFNPHERVSCLWNIVMEKACTPCMEMSGNSTNAADFGIDDSVVNKPPWATSSMVRLPLVPIYNEYNALVGYQVDDA